MHTDRKDRIIGFQLPVPFIRNFTYATPHKERIMKYVCSSVVVVLALLVSACVDRSAKSCTEQNSCNIYGPTGPSGGLNPVITITSSSPMVSTNVGCNTLTFIADNSVIWRSSDPTVLSIISTGSNTATGTGLKAGTVTVRAMWATDTTVFGSVVVTVNNNACSPNNGGASFVGAGFKPADTTIVINTRYHLRGQITVPTGGVTEVLVKSTKSCIAYLPPTVASTPTLGVYDVDITVQGIATCRDSIAISLKADTTVKTHVFVTVVPLPGPTITVTPPGGSGPKGGYNRVICLINGAPSTDCRNYSTDPSRIDVVAPSVDTTFATFTAPWGLGLVKGGTIYFASPGTANVCSYWRLDPRVAVCYAWTTTAAASGYMASIFGGTQQIEHDGHITPQMEEMYNVGRDRQRGIEMKFIK